MGEQDITKRLSAESQARQQWLEEPVIGSLVAERWELLEHIGEGGMSSVYKARHVIMNRFGAIKFLKGGLANDPLAVKRFQQEALTSGSLNHPNIVEVFDCGLSQYGAYMILEYLEGVSLTEVLETRQESIRDHSTRGALSFEEALPIMLEICDGLEHAHKKGVVHRDIKPSNVMLVEPEVPKTDDPDEMHVKLVDFGIAKMLGLDGTASDGQLTRTGEVFGSPVYMSPEQCLGRPLDGRSDIYSLGCLMYECLTGAKILMGANSTETMLRHVEEDADVSPLAAREHAMARPFAQVIGRCLARSPEDRYDDVAALREDLRNMQKKPRAAVSSGIVHPAFYLLALTTVLIALAAVYAILSEKPVDNFAEVEKVGSQPLAMPSGEARKMVAMPMTSARIFDGGELLVQRLDLPPERKIRESEKAIARADQLLAKSSFEEARLQYEFVKSLLSPIRFNYPLAFGPLLRAQVGILTASTQKMDENLDIALGQLILSDPIYDSAPAADKIFALQARACVQIRRTSLEPAADTIQAMLEQYQKVEQLQGRLTTKQEIDRAIWRAELGDILRLSDKSVRSPGLTQYKDALTTLESIKLPDPDSDFARQLKKYRAQINYRLGLDLQKDEKPKEAIQAFNRSLALFAELNDQNAPEIKASRVQTYLTLKHVDRLESLKYRWQNHI